MDFFKAFLDTDYFKPKEYTNFTTFHHCLQSEFNALKFINKYFIEGECVFVQQLSAKGIYYLVRPIAWIMVIYEYNIHASRQTITTITTPTTTTMMVMMMTSAAGPDKIIYNNCMKLNYQLQPSSDTQ